MHSQCTTEPFFRLSSTPASMPFSFAFFTFFLFFFYACVVLASPLPSTAIDHNNSRAEDQRCHELTECRTKWSIVWTCFNTTIACVWVSVHPNIPAPNDNEWKVRGRKLVLDGLVFMASEYIVMLTFFQWPSARKLVQVSVLML